MSQVQQVKDSISIVQVVGERLQLARAGTYWKANCPFHGEKTPSFFVNDQFQRYKCFGCGETGDVLTFLEKYEGMTFTEALQYLADRAGITLTQYQVTAVDQERTRQLSVLNLAKEYYHYILTTHQAGQAARDYLHNRGVTQESIKIFQLGFALPSWDGLIDYLCRKKKYSLADLLAVGLVVDKRGASSYDRFRQRLMFPLNNHRGQVVGFSGRVLDATVKEAKYINSPETELYHKSKMLYGLSELFQEIRKQKAVIVVEGEFDVISSAQAHVNNVVAIKGSALTTNHLQLLARVADKIIFALDMDSAGVIATKRAIALTKDLNFEIRVAQLPSGKDPDELARTDPKAWRDAVHAAISPYDFLLQAAAKTFDPQTPEGKRHILVELAPVLNDIPLVIEQDVYIKKMAVLLGVKPDLVRVDLEKLRLKDRNTATSRPSQAGPAKPQTNQPKQPNQSSTPPITSRLQKLEEYLLFLWLQTPPKNWSQRSAELPPSSLSHPTWRELTKRLAVAQVTSPLAQILSALPQDLQSAAFEVATQYANKDTFTLAQCNKEWQQTLCEYQKEVARVKLTELQTKLHQLEERPTGPNNDSQQQELLQQISHWQKLLK